jgi:hypothetical protein
MVSVVAAAVAWVSMLNDDTLGWSRCEKMADRVVDIQFTLNDHPRREEGTQPVQFGTWQSLQPCRGVRNVIAYHEQLLAIGNFASDIRDRHLQDGGWHDIEILDSGNSGFVASIVMVQNLLDAVGDHVPQKRLNRLVLHLRVLDSNRSLKNANTLGVLIENRLDVFGSPQRILWNGMSKVMRKYQTTHLFEPHLKIRIKDWNKWDWFFLMRHSLLIQQVVYLLPKLRTHRRWIANRTLLGRGPEKDMVSRPPIEHH